MITKLDQELHKQVIVGQPRPVPIEQRNHEAERIEGMTRALAESRQLNSDQACTIGELRQQVRELSNTLVAYKQSARHAIESAL